MTIKEWTKADNARVEALGRAGIASSGLVGNLSAEIRVGDRELFAVKGRSGAVVWCEENVAELPFGKGALSIPGMRRGMTAKVDGRTVRIWRPRFGMTLGSRVLHLEGGATVWLIIPEGLRKYRVTDQTGADILRRDRSQVLAEETLPSSDMSLLALVHVTGIVQTSSMLWYLAQGL
jgi:hypothetical protein